MRPTRAACSAALSMARQSSKQQRLSQQQSLGCRCQSRGMSPHRQLLILLVAIGALSALFPASASPSFNSPLLLRLNVSRPIDRLLDRLTPSRFFERRLAAKNCGVCCSVGAPRPRAGTPVMMSSWWLNTFRTGQQIQIKSGTWGTWWRPTNRGRSGALVTTGSATQPSSSEFFRVIVTAKDTIKLRTTAGTYVAVSKRKPAGYSDFPLITTSNARDPSTTFFTARRGPNTFFYSPTARGYVLSITGGQLMAGASAADAYERFRVVEVKTVPAIRGVNLGSWLVYEYWMDPNAFPVYANVLDGSRVTLFNQKRMFYLNAPQGGGQALKCEGRSSDGTEETFRVQTTAPNRDTYHFLSEKRLYWQLRPGSATPTADASAPSARTLFTFLRNNADNTLVLIQAPGGMLLQATDDGKLTANLPRSKVNLNDAGLWSGRAAWRLTVTKEIRYDWQLAYQWGSQAAPRIRSIRSSLITESDWRYMARQGVNAVRVPVAYWIAQGDRPDPPFVGGAIGNLDWAFRMAAKYRIRIMFSMHQVAGTQSGSFGSRLGYVDFPRGGNVKKTLAAIRFLARRYARNPYWMGMGLMNEPSLSVPLDLLKSYYERAYAIVRQYSPCAYLAIEGQYGPGDVQWVLAGEPNVLLETHIYDVFNSDGYGSAAEEIQSMRVDRAATIASHQQYGRPLLIGEFSNAMGYDPVTPEEQREWSLAQMQVFAKARAGWFFWSLKINKPGTKHWSFYLSSEEGLLPKRPNGQWY